MKATGIVRRIDDLGRVVIPKEIRRTMRIREGDPLEIYTTRDGEVIFKKYSLIGGLEEFAAQFCDTLSRSTDFSAAITDRDAVIAISGVGKKELLGKSVSPELEQVMTRRSLYCGDGVPVAEGNGAFRAAVAAPILCEGDVLGAVLFVGGTHLMNSLYVNDIYMQISLVMLIGLAAKNAILVVEYADRLFREQGASLMDAAIGAAKLRVRPIIMTAFAFILGVMPLVFASGVYATARNIMGVALVGGMLFATLLGIFVYPALYYFVGRIGNFERRRERKKQEEKL